MMHLKSKNGVNDCARFYESDEGKLVVEISECEYDHSANSLMTLWVKHGWMPRFFDRTLSVHTYYRDEEGNCHGVYNPQRKTRVDEFGNRHAEINFDWMLEATPENERRLLRECERLMLDDPDRYQRQGASA